ncbi:MAG: PRC-barrel domain-containing protein [Pyrinomonadaceae bacterium]
MAKREVRVEQLLGRRVYAVNGRRVGHLEEVRAAMHHGECLVEEYLVGSYAVFERLAALSIGRALLGRLGAYREGGGYRVPWDKLDLSDPTRPRLLCSVEELEKLHG